MVDIEVYNFLDGKNLCNIFASLLVDKINELIPNSNTELKVINVRNFFIVRGFTTSDQIINCASIFQNYVNQHDIEMSKTIKVIDLILYNVDLSDEVLNLSISSDKYVESSKISIEGFLNGFIKKDTRMNIKMVDGNVLFDHSSDKEDDLIQIIQKEFGDKKITRSDFSKEIYISDDFFGMSNNSKKYYLILLEYIKNHLFKKSISSSIQIKLFAENINSVNNENCSLRVVGGKHIVNTEWLESLILDVFPFELTELKNKFDLKKLDYSENIENGNIGFPWEKLDLLNELILF